MPFSNTASWSASHSERPDERRVRREFWRKARQVAARLPFASDLLAAYYCAFDRTTPMQVRAGLIAALAYFVLPTDAVPDFIAGLGYTDDAAVLLGTVKLVASHIRPEHQEAAKAALDRIGGKGP